MKKTIILSVLSIILLSGCEKSGFHKIDPSEALEIINELSKIEQKEESLIINIKNDNVDKNSETEIKINCENNISYYKNNEIEYYTTRELIKEISGYEYYKFTTYKVDEKKIYTNNNAFNAFHSAFYLTENSELEFLKLEIKNYLNKNTKYTFYKNLAGSFKCKKETLHSSGDTTTYEIIFNKKGQVLHNKSIGTLIYDENSSGFKFYDTKYEKNIKYKEPKINLPNIDEYTTI